MPIFRCIIPEPLHIPPMWAVFTLIALFQMLFLYYVYQLSLSPLTHGTCFFFVIACADISITPATTLSAGILKPITPVDATSTDSFGIFKYFSAASAVFSQHSNPSSPVQAFAIRHL